MGRLISNNLANFFLHNEATLDVKIPRGARNMKFVATKGLSLVVICTALACTQPALGAGQQPFRVGVAKVDITPLDLNEVTAVTRRQFQGVQERLYARALVIDNGDNIAVIVGVDLVHYGNTLSLRQRVERELGIPVDNIMIAPSHDHSAPRAGPPTPGTAAVTQRRPYSPPAYLKQADDTVVEAIRQAREAMQSAQVGVGSGTVDVNVYRYAYFEEQGRWRAGLNPDGPSDKTVWVVKFADLSGKLIALIMNYAVHSNIWTGASQEESQDMIYADISGMAQRYVEQHFQDEAVAIFTMGAAGDQYAKFNKEMDDTWDNTPAAELVDIQGRMLGMEVIQTASRIPQMSSLANIRTAQRAVPCEMVARESQQSGATLDIQLGLIRINETAITGVSGEIATNVYARLRQESPLRETIIATLVNDRAGYIPDEENWERMGAAFVRGCAEDAIVDNLVEMIKGTL